MMDTMTLKAGLSALRARWSALDDRIATSMEDWLLDFHQPWDASDAQDGSRMVCIRCPQGFRRRHDAREKAPCREYMRTLDRRAERRNP